MDAGRFIVETEELLKDSRFDVAFRKIDELDPGDFEGAQAFDLLQTFRAYRQFQAVEKSANVFLVGGHDDAAIRRHLALSLIEQDRITQALRVAEAALGKIPDDDVEYSEMLGVVGRCHKQTFVSGGSARALEAAIDAYRRGWELSVGDRDWHGINLVGLLERAARDGIDTADTVSARAIAAEITARVRDSAERQPWDLANAMEASLALGDSESTMHWAKQYVSHEGTDAFALAGTLRQLREIWQFDATPVGRALEPVLEYELLRRPGGSIDVQPDDSVADTSGFEAVYGSESFTHVRWLETLFEILNSVARIRHSLTGKAEGTGFLVDGALLDESLAGSSLLVTNSHVVSDKPVDEAPLEPAFAEAEFTRLPDKPAFALQKLRFYSPRAELDVWICEIDTGDALKPLSVSAYRPLLPVRPEDPPQHIFVIGHPLGGDLAVSLFNNDLVGYEDPYVHYKSPTEGGSSGSPVLSRDLRVFAVHHRARADLKANEGVLFEHVQKESQNSRD